MIVKDNCIVCFSNCYNLKTLRNSMRPKFLVKICKRAFLTCHEFQLLSILRYIEPLIISNVLTAFKQAYKIYIVVHAKSPKYLSMMQFEEQREFRFVHNGLQYVWELHVSTCAPFIWNSYLCIPQRSFESELLVSTDVSLLGVLCTSIATLTPSIGPYKYHWALASWNDCKTWNTARCHIRYIAARDNIFHLNILFAHLLPIRLHPSVWLGIHGLIHGRFWTIWTRVSWGRSHVVRQSPLAAMFQRQACDWLAVADLVICRYLQTHHLWVHFINSAMHIELLPYLYTCYGAYIYQCIYRQVHLLGYSI